MRERHKHGILGFARRKAKTSNKILAVSVIAVIGFTLECLHIQCDTGVEVSSTLITLWYSFWTAEVVSLAGIKIFKVKNNYDGSRPEDDGTDAAQEGCWQDGSCAVGDDSDGGAAG